MLEYNNRLICGDNREVMAQMPDGVFQTCITSPPYWSLRDYGLEPTVWDDDPECQHIWGSDIPARRNRGTLDIRDGESKQATNRASAYDAKASQFCQKCGCWKGTLGLEPSPELYVKHIVDIFREVWRVLRPDGTCWLNIGDSYAGSWGNHKAHHKTGGLPQKGLPVYGKDEGWTPQATPKRYGLKPKDLCLIPFRLAIALQADGWWVRSDIIWAKTNPMPESVRDRPTKAHEYVFLLSKSQRYYYDQDAIAEPSIDPESYSGRRKRNPQKFDSQPFSETRRGFAKLNGETYPTRNKRTVWTISTQPYPEAHFATFPEKLVTPMILAGTSPQACQICGAPWKRVVEKETRFEGGSGKAGRTAAEVNASGKWEGKQYGENIKLGPVVSTETLGWQATCKCENDGSGKSIVFDPFCGSGTTCAVAKKLGRAYVGIEQNPDYVLLSERRLEDTEIEVEDNRQLDMFAEAAGD